MHILGQCRPRWQTTSVTPQAFINVEQASLVGGMTLFQLITINLEYFNMTRHSLMLVNNLFLPRLCCCESGPVNAQWHGHNKMKETAEQKKKGVCYRVKEPQRYTIRLNWMLSCNFLAFKAQPRWWSIYCGCRNPVFVGRYAAFGWTSWWFQMVIDLERHPQLTFQVPCRDCSI